MEEKDIISRQERVTEAIKFAILSTQTQALQATNKIQLALYFAIGRFISLNSRKSFWNAGILSFISNKLQSDLPGLRGFSEGNLKKMRIFYEQWQILDPKSFATANDLQVEENNIEVSLSVASVSLLQNNDLCNFPLIEFFQVPFTHHYTILSHVKNLQERYFYLRLCAEQHLSKSALQVAIDRNEYLHRANLPNNFYERLSPTEQARKAILAFKDEYVLDFINVEELGVRDIEEVDERVVEKKIVHNIKNFIMTFGKDFAFLGNQYRVEAMGHTHIIDLLFYNRELSCLVAVELKTGAFKNSYLGQLNAYLNILDDYVRKPNENKSIGIILCKSVDKTYAEYMIRTYENPMGVATFKTANDMPERLRKALPDIEELKKLL